MNRQEDEWLATQAAQSVHAALVRLLVAVRQCDGTPIPETRSSIDKQAVHGVKPTALSLLQFGTRTAEQDQISRLGAAATNVAIGFHFKGVVQHSHSDRVLSSWPSPCCVTAIPTVVLRPPPETST